MWKKNVNKQGQLVGEKVNHTSLNISSMRSTCCCRSFATSILSPPLTFVSSSSSVTFLHLFMSFTPFHASCSWWWLPTPPTNTLANLANLSYFLDPSCTFFNFLPHWHTTLKTQLLLVVFPPLSTPYQPSTTFFSLLILPFPFFSAYFICLWFDPSSPSHSFPNPS